MSGMEDNHRRGCFPSRRRRTPRPSPPKHKHSITAAVNTWMLPVRLKVPLRWMVFSIIAAPLFCPLVLHFGTFMQATSDERVGYRGGPLTRGTLNVIWTCLSTIFSCVYVALHFDIPAQTQPWWLTLANKWVLVGLGLFAPEVMLGRSCYEFFRARESVKHFSRAVNLRDPEVDADSEKMLPSTPPSSESNVQQRWTMVHALFTQMGGFVRLEDGEKVPVTIDEIENYWGMMKPFLNEYLEEIKDKSKADPLVKVLVCLQVTWFLVTILARRYSPHRLPLTQLEIATCGHIVCALSTYFFWWYKPYNIHRPIVVPPLRSIDELNKDNATVSARPISEVPTLVQLPASSSKHNTLQQPNKPGGGVQYHPETEDHYKAMKACLLLGLFGSVVYGTCHLLAWDFIFVYSNGRTLWRICSVIVTALPIVHVCLTYLMQTKRVREAHLETKVWFKVIYFGSLSIYATARVALLILIFVAFGSMPPDVYTQTDWVSVVPRIE